MVKNRHSNHSNHSKHFIIYRKRQHSLEIIDPLLWLLWVAVVTPIL